jgi:hypothetical protein
MGVVWESYRIVVATSLSWMVGDAQRQSASAQLDMWASQNCCNVHRTLSTCISSVLPRVSDPNLRKTTEFCDVGATHPRPPTAHRDVNEQSECASKGSIFNNQKVREGKHVGSSLMSVISQHNFECAIVFVDKAHIWMHPATMAS